MAMRDRAPLDIDDVLRQIQLAHHDNRDRRKGLVDLDAVDVIEFPTGAVECLVHRGNGSKAEHSGLDGGDAVGDESGYQFETTPLRPIPIRESNTRCASILSPFVTA